LLPLCAEVNSILWHTPIRTPALVFCTAVIVPHMLLLELLQHLRPLERHAAAAAAQRSHLRRRRRC
jgi:hypothetical protein